MKLHKTDFEGLVILEPSIFSDERGFFYESFKSSFLKENNLDYQFIQDNQSRSKYGVIRGLHYQLGEYAQAKLVRSIHGKILDVVVDLRPDQPTYKKVYYAILSSENKKQLLIPRGFAHGFSVLSDYAEVVYKCDNIYHPTSERGIFCLDQELNIDWKLPVDMIQLSSKDKLHPKLSKACDELEKSTRHICT